MTVPPLYGRSLADPDRIAACAVRCLRLEVRTWPKPGLVSHRDRGAHGDMDAALLELSVDMLEPFFADLARAGSRGATMDGLRSIGRLAEAAMLRATGGVNTHRGAIFGLGLLCAAEGFRQAFGVDERLGGLVKSLWGDQILDRPLQEGSHGHDVERRYGAGGARTEAAAGFPSVYDHALPALTLGRALAPEDAEAQRVQACMALVAAVEDANLLHRAGREGLAFAQGQARRFLDLGGIGAQDWRPRASAMHDAFVKRRLSPGGCADLLAMALFVCDVEGSAPAPLDRVGGER